MRGSRPFSLFKREPHPERTTSKSATCNKCWWEETIRSACMEFLLFLVKIEGHFFSFVNISWYEIKLYSFQGILLCHCCNNVPICFHRWAYKYATKDSAIAGTWDIETAKVQLSLLRRRFCPVTQRWRGVLRDKTNAPAWETRLSSSCTLKRSFHLVERQRKWLNTNRDQL